jgi:hypothetical protein
METDKTEKAYIPCLGVDGKWHLCEPHLDVCKCGVKVRSKKDNKELFNKHCACYECTY